MAELLKHAEGANITVAQVVMANEVAVSGKSEAEIYAFIDKISNAMVNIVKSGLAAPEGDAARTDQAEDQGRRRLQARDGRQVRAPARPRRGVGLRARRIGRKRARPPGGDRADRRIRRRDAGAGLRASAKAAGSCRRTRSATDSSPRRRSATCASTTRRCRAPKADARRRSASRRRWARRSSRRRTTSRTRSSPMRRNRRCSITSA